jgi:hypothetical protein
MTAAAKFGHTLSWSKKNTFGEQTYALVANRLLILYISDILTPCDRKKRNTARCSTTVHFESTAKQDL